MFRCFKSHHVDKQLEQNQHPSNVFSTCLAWLYSWRQSFSSPCCEDTHSRHLKKMLLHLPATRRKGVNHGCNSLRQEAGTGTSSRIIHSRIPTKWPTHSALYREEQDWVDTGWQARGNLSWWHKKSQHSHVPALGNTVRESFTRANVCSIGVLAIRKCLEQDHLFTCSGTFSQHAACCQIFKTQF